MNDEVTSENHCFIASWGTKQLLIMLTRKLEQLERLSSEDTPHCLMITHTIESYWIPSQKKTMSKLQIY